MLDYKVYRQFNIFGQCSHFIPPENIERVTYFLDNFQLVISSSFGLSFKRSANMLNPFMADVPILCPLKAPTNLFWMFQGVWCGSDGQKLVKVNVEQETKCSWYANITAVVVFWILFWDISIAIFGNTTGQLLVVVYYNFYDQSKVFLFFIETCDDKDL